MPALSLVALGAAAGLTIWQWNAQKSIVAGALRIDNLSLALNFILIAGGAAQCCWHGARSRRSEAAHGEFHALLLTSIGGMSLLAAAQNTVALFIGPGAALDPAVRAVRERNAPRALAGVGAEVPDHRLGRLGDAALRPGADLRRDGRDGLRRDRARRSPAAACATDLLLLTGIALCVAGLCFKASVAPFHQWTPDVYEGAPTPVTAFMAVATKVAALGVFLRFFDVALVEAQQSWGPALAALAAITIIVGNVGALGQSSLKRMLAYSSVAQAGYMLAGVVVATKLGVRATVFYLAVYLFMNMAAFAVILARERETGAGDSVRALAGLGRERPYLAWPMTLAMLGLAGIPATAGFMGKFYLIDAAVSGGYTWLGVVIVIGSMISLGYYLPVVAAMWMREAPAGRRAQSWRGGLPGEPAARDRRRLPRVGCRGRFTCRPSRGGEYRARQRPQPEVVFVAVLAGAATLFFGIVPQPLFDFVQHAGRGFGLF